MKITVLKPPDKLLPESAKYWREIHQEYRFSRTEEGIVRTLVRTYDTALRALEDVRERGATIISNGQTEKRNPNLELFKAATSAYLQSCRLLGLQPKKQS